MTTTRDEDPWEWLLQEHKGELRTQLSTRTEEGFMPADHKVFLRLKSFPLSFLLFVHRLSCPHCQRFRRILRAQKIADLAAEHNLLCFSYDLAGESIPKKVCMHPSVPILVLVTMCDLGKATRDQPALLEQCGFREWNNNQTCHWYHFYDEFRRERVAECCAPVFALISRAADPLALVCDAKVHDITDESDEDDDSDDQSTSSGNATEVREKKRKGDDEIDNVAVVCGGVLCVCMYVYMSERNGENSQRNRRILYVYSIHLGGKFCPVVAQHY